MRVPDFKMRTRDREYAQLKRQCITRTVVLVVFNKFAKYEVSIFNCSTDIDGILKYPYLFVKNLHCACAVARNT